MILILQSATNSGHCIHVDKLRNPPPVGSIDTRFSGAVNARNGRRGLVAGKYGERYRVLLQVGLPFAYPEYYTEAELTALNTPKAEAMAA